MTIIALDFEASCLPRHGRSYPIEIGIADEHGLIRSWLIRPPDAWAGWGWTQEAERLHGISKEQLARDGLPPARVVAELEPYVRGARVIADSHFDAPWLTTLSALAAKPPPCAIGHVADLLEEMGAAYEHVEAALRQLDRQPFRRHRAAEDARFIIALVREVRGQVEKTRKSQPVFDWRRAPPIARPSAYRPSNVGSVR
ncbi:hypothetical protein RN629_15825 [Sphingomonadaceae bacterium jetA1]|uniref:3'-5' exonuclease n=1 Tax=Facivitalis istanbulensis TaxID=3075838 RepID=UPI003479E556